MKIRDRIRIQARPEDVWPVMSDLERLPEWLPKCTAVLVEDLRSVRVGTRFNLERTWKQDTRVSDVLIEVWRPGERMAWTETMWLPDGESIIREEFNLIAKASTCKLRHAITITDSGLPVWAQCLWWFIHTMGRPTGKTGLMKLKDMVETGKKSSER